MSDLLTAVIVIIVILLVFRLSKDHDLAIFTEDGKVERTLLSLVAGLAVWKVMGHMNRETNVTGADESDNVLEPSNLSLEEY